MQPSYQTDNVAFQRLTIQGKRNIWKVVDENPIVHTGRSGIVSGNETAKTSLITRRNFLALLLAERFVGDIFSPKESSEKAWVQFASDLADTLADLGEEEFLIISVKKNWHYVQFAGRGKFGMRAEARSNAYTDANNKLSEPACAKLLSLGWKAPTYVPDDFHSERNGPDGSPNYFVDVGVSVPYGSIAKLAVNTLRGPFRAAHPGELQYKAFASAHGNIRFPNLHIARKP